MSTPALGMRLAEASDLPAIVTIFNEAIAMRISVAFTQPVSIAERSAWFFAHTPLRYPIHVACQGSEVVARLSVSPYSERQAYDATAEISAYVRASVQRGGIASALLAHAAAAARAVGITRLVARIFGSNAKSIAFFERRGFERWGCLPKIGIVDGEPRDLIVYGKVLV